MGPFPFLNQDGLAALEILGVPIYVYDPSAGRVCWSNAAALRFWNAASTEDLFARDLAPYSDSTKGLQLEFLERLGNAEVIIQSLPFASMPKAAPAICRCTGISLDSGHKAILIEILDWRQAERPLQELQAILALRRTEDMALRQTPLLVSMFSEAGHLLMRNPAAHEYFCKFDKNKQPDTDLFQAMFADPTCHQQLVDEVRTTGEAAVRVATLALDTQPRHILQVASLTDPITARIVWLVTHQLVSEATLLHNELPGSEDSLDTLINFAAGPVLVVSLRDGTVVKASFSAQVELGVVSSLEAKNLFSNKVDYVSFFASALANRYVTAELQMKRASGTPFWATLSGTRITYDEQDVIVVRVTDISKPYMLAAEFEAALDVELKTTEMQRRILAVASHDMRTPLAIIDSTALMLERVAELEMPDPELLRSRTRRIRGTVQRILHLLENTIEAAVEDMGTQGYAPRIGSICDLVSAVAQGFMEVHPYMQLSIDLTVIPPISFDEALMERALGNLLTNAVKYSGGIARVMISVVAKGEDVHIDVRDYGIGIPASYWKKVFGDFVRADNVGVQPGAGLGLSIVREIVSLHGGTIDIIESDGPGTTMRIALPRT